MFNNASNNKINKTTKRYKEIQIVSSTVEVDLRWVAGAFPRQMLGHGSFAKGGSARGQEVALEGPKKLNELR